MRFAIVFGVYGATLAAAAVFASGPFSVPLAWAAASCLLVACAYAFNRPRLLGKRDDGTQSTAAVVALAPYLLVQHVVWFLADRLRGGPSSHEVGPGLWLGRRPWGREVPPEVRTVVDLTAEFHEAADVRAGREYVCVATLDATAPTEEMLDRVVTEVVAQREPVLVHCASGHGRSALLVACALLARGDVANIEDAIARIKAVRPRARLNAVQRSAFAGFVARRKSATTQGPQP